MPLSRVRRPRCRYTLTQRPDLFGTAGVSSHDLSRGLGASQLETEFRNLRLEVTRTHQRVVQQRAQPLTFRGSFIPGGLCALAVQDRSRFPLLKSRQLPPLVLGACIVTLLQASDFLGFPIDLVLGKRQSLFGLPELIGRVGEAVFGCLPRSLRQPRLFGVSLGKLRQFADSSLARRFNRSTRSEGLDPREHLHHRGRAVEVGG
ncbi:MAG TPA: hypothetical protein DEQ43_25170 [Nocardioides bacterium]|nr:hypothetical protein [Nocardioides sp.]